MPDYRLGRLKGEFVATWWEDGKRRRYRLFAHDEAPELRKSKKEAERRMAALHRRVETSAQPTIGELWSAYQREKSGRRVAAAMSFEWKAMGPHFGHLRADDITTAACRNYVAKRRASGRRGKTADGTIWTEMGRLRSVLRWAVDNRLIEHAPPVERPAKPAPKERHLTRSECERLIDAASAAHVRLAILLMLSTAARIGAVLDLTWDRVDFARGIVNLRSEDMSTRKGRAVVPMTPALRAALASTKELLSPDAGEHVIQWADEPVKSIKTGFNAAVKAAGLSDVSPHVLRHTAAVHMAEAGVPMTEIAAVLGHEDSRVTERVYARYSPDHLRGAVASLDFGRLRQVQGDR